MNREQELNKQFPLEDGTTYIQSIDKSNELKGAGVGGESLEENFIDSASPKLEESIEDSSEDKLNTIYEKLDRDYMYNWIKGHKNRK
jgi:hypothetical protein